MLRYLLARSGVDVRLFAMSGLARRTVERFAFGPDRVRVDPTRFVDRATG